MSDNQAANANAPEVSPAVLAARTKTMNAQSDPKAIAAQIKAEREMLSKINKYRELASETPDFSQLDDSEQERYWRIIWGVMDSGVSSGMARDKAYTLAVLRKVAATRSRYIGVGDGGARLFLSQSGTITKIVRGRDNLIVVWPAVASLKRETVESEMRIQYLERLQSETAKRNSA
jgi:hypothetical protein